MAEEYISSRARGYRFLLPHERGRGQVRFQKYETSAPRSCSTNDGGGATSTKCVRLKKLLRRTEELTKKCFLRGEVVLQRDSEARTLAASIQQDVSSLAPDLPAQMNSSADFGQLRRALRMEIGFEQTMLVQHRKDQWKEATRCDWHTNRKEIYNLVKDKTPGNLTTLKREDGTYTCNLSELDYAER